ncbi:erythrocyte membrane protein 1 (PfEMP1), exon, putative [Plasmodium sp. DRC-Itaito]|nr:erythrocyte membrane protein 1 (PfEMP1), exon, putative [Plasmodium sp. DRC-Itaito]SOV25527.1 erythrocyte membrane protein 1 (PfEMP1), exon, putative [Plasmodium sp. DRC-Itaito]SOV25548.1 erythrocyte membrane protein 1 (PfEMP1), exon, putative [Plasmodium sp. DRC-Itaito]SOV25565.1 erythrocyte membrane protein 1 (PfEMP1), exon, putative [Plasmodium sp. DRC-Itaito]SOV25567.1 erythrocyte membrane protein 1 (PfEMP1), exon, putative [Plasmodium sp. DRC-Itaito]
MCNQWNNKEEMLHKLNEEWNNEHNEHILDIPLNDNDINKNNDENYNMISTNIHQANDTTTENINFQTKNLRTNISMDIHFDENNNNNNMLTTNITNEEDHLENFYNS